MNRREFIKLSLVTLVSRVLHLNYHQPGRMICLDNDDAIPDVPKWASKCRLPPWCTPVWIVNGAGEMYVSHDFWMDGTPTWERASSPPPGDYVTLSWDDMWAW